MSDFVATYLMDIAGLEGQRILAAFPVDEVYPIPVLQSGGGHDAPF